MDVNITQYVLAKEIANKLHRDIEPSNDEWDRGYNAGLRHAIRTVKEYVDCYEKKHNVSEVRL